ncbi:MAG: glycine reductase [Nitrospinaceae bacterium]|nr:glycine reductase [Nitrospinaceae bacterium]MBT3435531.1 glycine reductase [Nitrospinaceae bacterium]MBT3820322.1 glycine reductase [Nitrospinaceae bacterium]MBT4094876.1 glycine reductase [Nitrospinaceae bacterium]MBT4430433.1 glycine reductase [Nitrospinaceae bacterium]
MTAYLRAATNILVHVPDLVRYGSKPWRETSHNNKALGDVFADLRSFDEVVDYAPNQAFIGNLAPEKLNEIASPWYENSPPGASPKGVFGEVLPQEIFYSLLELSDQFGLFMFDEQHVAAKLSSDAASALLNKDKPVKKHRQEDILQCIEAGEALPLFQGRDLVGCVRRDHEFDESLDARVLLENLAAKASGAFALRHLLVQEDIAPDEIEYVISCSEEAVGDRYNRGGGNLAKAIAEMAGCVNAAGVDVKSFCAAPVYAIVHAAALIQSGVVRNVVVVGGGSMAKLGMKAYYHMEKEIPILEDVLGGVAFLLSSDSDNSPRINLEIAGRHTAGSPSTPQVLAETLVRDPLARAGRKISSINKYAVELHNPEVMVPAGAGDVAATNYKMLAAMAVMGGEIAREEIPEFIETHGMPGFAPTQGHIPAGVPFLGHALSRMRAGTLQSTMIMAKGSLFLGRMSQQADGASILIEV